MIVVARAGHGHELPALRDPGTSHGAADVARLMHAVNQGENTIQSMVFEPTPLRLHVGLGQGPVTAGPLKAIELAPLMETSTKERITKPRKDENAKGT